MTTDDTADAIPADDAATHAYLDRVRREIDDEVRRRRAAGDFPPSYERRLDELFARFTPTGAADDHFTEALKLADRSAYFDIEVPIGPSASPGGSSSGRCGRPRRGSSTTSSPRSTTSPPRPCGCCTWSTSA